MDTPSAMCTRAQLVTMHNWSSIPYQGISNTHVLCGLGCHTVSTALTPLIYFLFYFIPISQ